MMACTLYFRDLPKNPSGIHVERTMFSENAVYPEHGHDFYEIQMVENGSIINQVNGKSIYMPEGGVWMIRPGDEHSLKISSRLNTASLLNVAFEPELYSRLCVFPLEKMQNVVLLMPSERSFVIRQMENIRGRQLQNADVAAAQGHALILNLYSLILQRTQSPLMMPPVWLQNCLQSMREVENLPWGLPRFIELSGVTQEHLCREMRRYYHTSPSEYVNQLKLEYACTLLRTTDMPVSDVSVKCGFNTTTYFNRLFQRVHGCSPREYREMI